MTEMESLAQLRRIPDKLDQFTVEDGRFDMFKLADETRSERPVHRPGPLFGKVFFVIYSFLN